MCAVEWKKLGKLGTFENIGVDKKIVQGEPFVTLLNYVDVYKNKYITEDIPTMRVTAPLKKVTACNVLKGDIFITPTSETKDDIGHTAVALDTLNNVVYSYHLMRYRLSQFNMINSYYINYIFDTFAVKEQIYKFANGLTRFGLSKDKFADIIIPYPSLAKQQEIVSQLDTFTTLISNLESELDMRRKQYEHYRNQLLDFEGVEKLPLSEVFEMRGGYTPSTKNDEFWEDGILPWFRMEDIRENGNILSDSTLHITPIAVKKNGLFPMNSIILATSATIGVHALLTVPALSNQRFTAFYPKEKYEDKVNYKYTYYVFYIIDEWCKNNIVQGGFASVDMAGLRKYLFPLPSLVKQQQIVEKLDAFEQLIQSLETEIKLRKQQYEYYREKLLTFD